MNEEEQDSRPAWKLKAAPGKAGSEDDFEPVDIGDMLKDNLARQLKHEKPAESGSRTFGRRRRRDYIVLMVSGNLLLLLALILVPGLLAKVSAGAGMVLYSVGVTWILYGVMSEY